MDTKERLEKVLSPEFREEFTRLYLENEDFRESMDLSHKAYVDGLRESMGLDETWHYRSGYTDLDSFEQMESLLGENMRMVVCSIVCDTQTFRYTVFISDVGLKTLRNFKPVREE